MASPLLVLRVLAGCGSHMCDPYVIADSVESPVDVDLCRGARHGEPVAGFAGAGGLRVALVRPLHVDVGLVGLGAKRGR